MKKFIKRAAQVATGAATAATLLAGRALATTYTITDLSDSSSTSSDSATVDTTSSNPIKEGADAVRAEGMPAEIKVVFSNITNTILFAVGVISVVMLIWGGIRYITSGGDSKKVTDAKNTILYAIVGLIIVLLSYSIVNFVVSALGGSSTD